MTPESVESLIAEIEAEDRLDFGDLDRRLAQHGYSAEERLEVMAAIAAHTMVENMALQLGRLRDAAHRADFRDWMKRHGIG